MWPKKIRKIYKEYNIIVYSLFTFKRLQYSCETDRIVFSAVAICRVQTGAYTTYSRMTIRVLD